MSIASRRLERHARTFKIVVLVASRSLVIWQTTRASALDEIEAAHRAIGGEGRGRRYATQQINQAFAVMVSSQFQGFCRELHAEAVDHLALVLPLELRPIVRARFAGGRRLDGGNANPGNLGADFARFGIDLWGATVALDHGNRRRQRELEELSKWRNAIAHQDFDPHHLGGRSRIGLADVRRWRRACNSLARSFDAVVRGGLAPLVGGRPW